MFLIDLGSDSDATEEVLECVLDQNPLFAAEFKSEPMLLRWLAKEFGLDPAGDVGVAPPSATLGTSIWTVDSDGGRDSAVRWFTPEVPDAADGVGLASREFRNMANGSGPSRLLRFVNWRTYDQILEMF